MSTPFDPTVLLPEGITVLEASAGTGKTYSVSSLVVAEVAAGRPLEELLVVTFTRKATGTLRERVWERVREVVVNLDHPVPADDLTRHLATGTPEKVARRRANLERALSNFDAATIATTHGFCQQVLASLGVAGDAERDLEVVEDVHDLMVDAVDDLFIRRFFQGTDLLFDRKEAMAIATAVVNHPDCRIAEVDDTPADRLRRQFAVTLRRRIEAQKREGRLITYDDLLARLDSSIEDPQRGELVVDRLRRRYSMAIVDEFQDTDTVQWRILQRAFGTAPCRLVLVGDPKQAIYAFRGGDVFAYLDATEEAENHRILPVNWRSDQPLLDQLDAFFAGCQLGDEKIRHRTVRARPGGGSSMLAGPQPGPPITVRYVDTERSGLRTTQSGVVKDQARELIANDVAAEAVRILGRGTTILGKPVSAGDLAVLTRTHGEADRVCGALATAGVPAVVHGRGTVLTTDAAQDWLDLLRALEQPARSTLVHRVTIGPFIGWDAAQLEAATNDDWDDVDAALHRWGYAARTQGASRLLQTVESTNGLTARLLAREDGERRVSDLHHLAELLDQRQSSHPGSLAALALWLAKQIADGDEVAEDRARRRLETDADAVSIHTIHSAKGLEFPIVLLPSVWDVPPRREKAPPVFHDGEGQRSIGVGSGGPIHQWQQQRAYAEADDEDLRLLYVALTRAKHQIVTWWATAQEGERAAFGRILCGTDPTNGEVLPSLGAPPEAAEIVAACAARGIATEEVPGWQEARYARAPRAPSTLALAAFDRTFDRHWTRTSYSGLTRAAHDAAYGDGIGQAGVAPMTGEVVEVDERAKVDEPEVAASPSPPDGPLLAPLPLGGIPGSARFGTMVHETLEHTDFASPSLAADLASAVVAAGAERIVPDHVDQLVAGLTHAVQTPLGSAWSGMALADLGRRDRLDELGFDLPLAGGDQPGPSLVTMDGIADVFAGLPADDPLAGYHERLRSPLLAASVRGFLNGSIDLVARIGDRHIVVDYKTNQLAPEGEAPVLWHYRPDALTAAMEHADYPLQAALYAVALHRYLRWRLPGYDPAKHLGGVSYLFLRGMTGESAALVDGQPCGVFAWHPPADFVTSLSDLLDRGVA